MFRNTLSLAITNFCTSTETEENEFGSEPSMGKWPVTGFTGKWRCSNPIHHSNTIESVVAVGGKRDKADSWEEAGIGRADLPIAMGVNESLAKQTRLWVLWHFII